MDYNIIWFILIVVLFVGYVVLDGFDLGVGMIHLSAKTDLERRISLNSIGPLWDGNEVWLITAGGALFAAFPNVYATVFSGFYIAFMLFLTVLIGRAVSLEFRSKIDNPTWKKVWDIVFTVSSYLIVLLLGVSLGNIVSGIPLADDMEFAGSFWGLLHPFAIFLGLTAILLLRMHGKIYFAIKTEGELQKRIASGINLSLTLFIIFYIILTLWAILAYPDLLNNYSNPIWFIFPLLIIISVFLIRLNVKKQKYFRAFIFSSLIIVSAISTVAVAIFPYFVISNPIPVNSLDIYNSSSTDKTLGIMFIIACIGVPLVLIYSVVVHRIFRGKVKVDSLTY